MTSSLTRKISKLALATSAAALFSTVAAPVVADDTKPKTATIKCQGANSCKGQSKCATAENACAGQNSCKGHGWIFTKTEAECTNKGGTPVI